jgi:hypothetical protein
MLFVSVPFLQAIILMSGASKKKRKKGSTSLHAGISHGPLPQVLRLREVYKPNSGGKFASDHGPHSHIERQSLQQSIRANDTVLSREKWNGLDSWMWMASEFPLYDWTLALTIGLRWKVFRLLYFTD